jgi:hypothetical protein
MVFTALGMIYKLPAIDYRGQGTGPSQICSHNSESHTIYQLILCVPGAMELFQIPEEAILPPAMWMLYMLFLFLAMLFSLYPSPLLLVNTYLASNFSSNVCQHIR